MKIIGHRLIKFDYFTMVENPREMVGVNNLLFKFDESLIEKAINKEFSVIAKDTREIVLANAFGAKFIILNDESLAKEAMELAEYYLFDSKIALIIENESELQNAINLRVDTVIYKAAIL
ncbi:MAG: hypothetical protein GX282_00970 [Campylobacteraceae bacterium]|nr:hypothetical protein [Campylobacteraceae bacterium]